MSLMICPECNKEVSDLALSCPNCGFPLTNQKNLQKDKNDNTSYSGKNIFGLIVFIVAATFVWLGFNHNNDANSIPETTNSTSLPSTPTDETVKPYDYSGTYYDFDRESGWETTIQISGTTFFLKSVATFTGESIANSTGIIRDRQLICNDYGEDIGVVTNREITINVGSAQIVCQKINK